jgi:hypothetical protein
MKRFGFTSVAGVAIGSLALLVSGASAAYAFTPTVSEVRYLESTGNSSDWDDSWYDLALTSDASTAVWSTDSGTYIVDVATNTATPIVGSDGGNRLILDATESFVYIAEGRNLFKVSMSTKAIVATWTDAAYTLAPSYLYLSADGASLFLVGRSGSYPNFENAVAKVNLATGAFTQYASGDPGHYMSRPAYDTTSGLIYIPTRDVATGLDQFFNVFDTASNTYTDLPWTDSGKPIDCDSQSGVVACMVDDTVDYVATIDASGAVVSSLNVDTAVSRRNIVTLTPGGTLAYVYGDNEALNNVEVVDLTTMSSMAVLNLATRSANGVRIAADAGEIWFTADYVRDYDGGYHVATFEDIGADSGSGEGLANTGANPEPVGLLLTLGGLVLAVGLVARYELTRRNAQR